MTIELLAVITFLCLLVAIPAGLWLGSWVWNRHQERHR